jgi:hypothetical protein
VIGGEHHHHRRGNVGAGLARCAGRNQAYESLAREVKSIVGGPVALTNRPRGYNG